MKIKRSFNVSRLFLTGTLFLLCSGSAFAASSALTVNGNISNINCSLSSSTNTIDLPQVLTTDFSGAGQRAGTTPYKIIVNCVGKPPRRISLEFSAPIAQVDFSTGALRNISQDAGASRNIEVELRDIYNNNMLINMASGIATLYGRDGDNVVEFPISATYLSTGSVSPGPVLASLTVDIYLP